MRKLPACANCPLHAVDVVAPQAIDNVYFGNGPLDADVAIVGEAPWKEELARGEYFVGKAGSLLSIIVASAGLDRKSLYITNVVKCCTLNPPPEAVAHCKAAYLDKELEVVKPNVVLALGNAAMEALTGRWGVTKWRGYLLEVDDGDEG